MRIVFKSSLLVFLLSCIASCTTISYVPKVSLDVSPQTIKKTVMVEKFTDLSPVADRKNPFGGVSVTNDGALTGGLDLEITNAIVSDFAVNGVFSQISRKIDNPDYIMKGEIIKFSGKSEMNEYAKFAFAAGIVSVIAAPVLQNSLIYFGVVPLYSCYLGIPVMRNSADIEIRIKLYDNNSNLLGTYRAKLYQDEMTSIYKNKMMAVPTLTNKTFSNVVQQLRDQILEDLSNK